MRKKKRAELYANDDAKKSQSILKIGSWDTNYESFACLIDLQLPVAHVALSAYFAEAVLYENS